jgi:integrase
VRALRNFVRQHASDPDRLDAVMAGWLIGQLRPHGRKGIRLSSARELLTRVDRKLAAVLGAHLPDKVADWDDAIQSIVQATGERHRNNIATALQQLDTHVRAHKRWDGAAPDLDDGVGSIVDAQLITESEFQSVLQALHLSAQPRRCLVAAILGYRCGLRRTEIRGLRWIDVQLHPQPLLFVRSHAGRALKRDSGRRVLLLTAFCPQAELNLLRQIHAETGRLLQNNPTYTQTALFLPDPQAPDQPQPEDALFNPVQEAMRAVCGEPSLRFHHLRHSAANTLLAQLMDGLTPGAAALLGVNPASSAPKRQALLGLGEDQRPLLWAVAAFMGHATPHTTLGSYVHLLDLLLGLAVQHDASPPPSKVIAWLTGSTVNRVDVQQHRLGPRSSWVVRSAHWVNKLATSSAHAQSLRCPWPEEPMPDLSLRAAQPSPVDSVLMNITDALALLAALRRDPYDTQSVGQVSRAQAHRIHQAMERWSQLRGTSPARHKRAERNVAPIVVGHLRLERPRTLKQLRSQVLRTTAQAVLATWRQWWQADAAAAEQALSLHWRLHDSDDHAVAFTALEDSRRWKQMLDTLSTRSPALQAHSLSWQLQPALRSAHTATEQVNHWATALGGAVTISVQPARSFHRSHPSPPDGQLRLIDGAHGKASPGGLIAALDAAAYVMTISILVRKGP